MGFEWHLDLGILQIEKGLGSSTKPSANISVSVEDIWRKLEECYNLEALEALVSNQCPFTTKRTHILTSYTGTYNFYRKPNTNKTLARLKTPRPHLNRPHLPKKGTTSSLTLSSAPSTLSLRLEA